MSYHEAKPFPHAVIDGFLPPGLARDALCAFPATSSPLWKTFTGNGRSLKREMADYSRFPDALKQVVDHVHGERLDEIGKLTGFDDLKADPSLYGGGLNLVEPGGYLDAHADYNWNDQIGMYRTVNVLIYLNADWQPGDGGELELWEGERIAKRIPPTFNRAVIFTTTSNSIHGYGPVKRTRRSMNFYMHRTEAAPGIDHEPHRTLWADKPMEHAQ